MIENKNLKMVGIGEVLWDMLDSGKQLGGAPANFAFHASQLGAEGVVISCIGKDSFGDEILTTLDEKKISHLLLVYQDYKTGRVDILMDSEGIPTFNIEENVAWDHLELNDEHIALAREADVVCFGSLAQRNSKTAEAIQKFISLTSSDCLRICDINLREEYYSQESINRLLELCTILKLNDDELVTISEVLSISGSETELLAALKKNYDLDLIILTKGAKGSLLFVSDTLQSEIKGTAVQVVDTVGAGDSFTATVAMGLCRGLTLQQIHPMAERVAAFVCGQSGATPSLSPVLKKLEW